MQISPINSVEPSFTGKNKKKKLNKRAVNTAILGTIGIAATYAYMTQRGKGGMVDLLIDRLRPAKDFVVGKIANLISKKS